jgi:hypothetical protein
MLEASSLVSFFRFLIGGFSMKAEQSKKIVARTWVSKCSVKKTKFVGVLTLCLLTLGPILFMDSPGWTRSPLGIPALPSESTTPGRLWELLVRLDSTNKR